MLTLSSALDDYSTELRLIRDVKPAYLTRIDRHLHTFFGYVASARGVALDELDLGTVTRAECIGALVSVREMVPGRHNARGVTYEPSTVRTMVAACRAFTRWAHAAGHLDKDPMGGIPLPRVPRKTQKVTTALDFAKLWGQAELMRWPARTRLMLGLLYGTGIRLDEMMGICEQDRGTTPGGVEYVTVCGKAGHERQVPLTQPLLVLWAAYVAERDARLRAMGVEPSEVPDLWIAARRQRRGSGVVLQKNAASIELRRLWIDSGEHTPGVGAHAFRRAFATAGRRQAPGVEAVYSDRQMEEQMGHAHAKVSGRYQDVTVEDLAACAQRHPNTEELWALLTSRP